MHVSTIIGARPQFIKAATVSRAFNQEGIKQTLIHTGQHYDANMSEVFFKELEIPKPDYNLGIGSLPHGAQTGRMLEAIETVMLDSKPDFLLVYGDTNSTLAGALAAAKLHIPVAHVEAGLRSFNRHMPEEINRVLTDHISDLLFAPTEIAVSNLYKEGITPSKIHNVGDVMYDAALFYTEKARKESQVLAKLNLDPDAYLLVTLHRAENTDDPERLGTVIEALKEVAQTWKLVTPLHPRTKAALIKYQLFDVARQHLNFTDPVGYLDMVMLEQHARAIITDSGGVQKEAFFHAVPCVTLRDETEWVELLSAGWNTLAPPHTKETITKAVEKAISSRPTVHETLYGDGEGAAAIARTLLQVV